MVEFFMLSCRGYDNYDLGSKSDTNVYMYTFSKDSFYGFFCTPVTFFILNNYDQLPLYFISSHFTVILTCLTLYFNKLD